jgi:uncharacterized protein (DUF2235 family)
MNKIWVVCIDGSWNTPGQEDQDPIDHQEAVTKTNVQITWEALSQKTLDDARPYGSIADLLRQPGQILYLNGVGSQGTEAVKKFEGTTGAGTTERVVDAYRFLAERWQNGDKIFGFAFSRGAFALRSLMGFIDCVGLPKHPRLIGDLELMDLLNDYRDQTSTDTKSATMQAVNIDFVGVWETVGALALEGSLNHFHQESPNNIQNFRQALALDEQRKEFLPVYFDANALQSQKEVWFAGAHSNVGGGYVDSNLSDIALFWMLNEAQQQGLNMDLSTIPGWKMQYPDGEIRNSYNEFWNAIPVVGKLMEKLHLEKVNRKIRSGQSIHESVLLALKQGYKPDAIPPDNKSITDLPVEK